MLSRLKRWFTSRKPAERKPNSIRIGPDLWASLDARPLPLSAMLAVANGRLTEEQIRTQAREVAKKLREANDSPAGIWASSFVDPFEFVADNADFFPGLGSGGWGVPWTLNNQGRGDVLPVYINEYGLKLIRDWSRRILAFNEFAINAVENRVSYIVGKGFQYSVLPKRKPVTSEQSIGNESGAEPGGLAKKAQAILDEFIDRERWNEREQECVRRCDRDGEAILRFFHVGGGRVAVRFVEPECLTDMSGPPSPADTGKGPTHRMYGVVTNAEDIEDVEAYSIVRNPQSGWVTEDVPSEKVLHIKANTDFDSKRGLPTLFPVRKNLERADKLLRNMSVMAQVQATFAVIRKHKQFAPSSVSAYQQGQSDFTGVVPASGRALQMQQMFPGSIIDSSDKTEYEFPSAGVDASGLVAILQAELRAVCSRLIMPDFMLLSDSTQSNFSGILVAEAPSTKNFERVQAWFARRFGDGEYGRREAGGGQLVGAMWRVLAMAVEHGLLPPETLTDMEIQCEGPSLVARDKKQETERAKVLSDAGLLSDATWSKWEGLDHDQEMAQGAKKQATPSPMGGPPGGGPPTEPHPPGSAKGGDEEAPDFFSEGLREEKDASGHEHAADGKFGKGGGTAVADEPESDDDDEEIDLPDALYSMGFDRHDVRKIENLDSTRAIAALSSKPKAISQVEIGKIARPDIEKEILGEIDPIEDADDVAPIIVGRDGDIIDGHHRMAGLLKGGAKTVNAIVVNDADMEAAEEFGGLNGRGSWPEEAWIKWMVARTDNDGEEKETSEGVDFFVTAAEEVKHVFGKCIDTDSHKTVPCPASPGDGGKGGNSPTPHPDPAHEKFSKEARAKLSSDIQAMEATPEGKATLAKGAKLAERVKGGIRAGVEKALAAVDAESKGGISLLTAGVKGKDAGAIAAGAGSLFNSVFMCVHEEVFENALSQHSIPGAHAVGMVAASVAVKLETGLLKAIAWSWSKLTEDVAFAEAGGELTDADKDLLAHLARVASNAVAAVMREAGAEDVKVDAGKMGAKILASLRPAA